MPRPERALDPGTGPVALFAHDLRELRRRAGGTPYRTMARTAHYSATVLSEAAAGRKLPTLAVTVAYVRACGGDPDEWGARWQALADELAATAEPGEPGESAEPADAPGPPAEPDGPARRSPWLRRERLIPVLSAVVFLLLGAVAVIVLLVTRTGEPQAGREVMPEHMVPRNLDATLGDTRTGRPAPSPARCLEMPRASTCLDLDRNLLWVKDLPPSDGHHAAAYWTTTDGAVHGECHNILAVEGPWVTCSVPAAVHDHPAVGLRVAVVERETVLEWGPYLRLPTG